MKFHLFTAPSQAPGTHLINLVLPLPRVGTDYNPIPGYSQFRSIWNFVMRQTWESVGEIMTEVRNGINCTAPGPMSPVFLKHYQFKSWEEFMEDRGKRLKVRTTITDGGSQA